MPLLQIARHITDCHAIAWSRGEDGRSSLPLQMPAALSSVLRSFKKLQLTQVMVLGPLL